jgi:cytidylate kinase
MTGSQQPDLRVIAIDGPSASGKSTVARAVAAALGCLYVDSGSLYRGVTWSCANSGITAANPAAVAAGLAGIEMEFYLNHGAIRFRLGGSDPGDALRSEAIAERVSSFAALPAVREWVVSRLRRLTGFGPLVMEGRDIGTAVFPDAPHKFYLDADPAERAARRYRELQQRGDSAEADRVRRALERRDAIDSTRSVAPLQIAADAVVIDTTAIPADAVAVEILKHLNPEAATKP